jgi:hypothetical protein
MQGEAQQRTSEGAAVHAVGQRDGGQVDVQQHQRGAQALAQPLCDIRRQLLLLFLGGCRPNR